MAKTIIREPNEYTSLQNGVFIFNETSTSITQLKVLVYTYDTFNQVSSEYEDANLVFSGVINKDNDDNFIFNVIEIAESFANSSGLNNLEVTTTSVNDPVQTDGDTSLAETDEWCKPISVVFTETDDTPYNSDIYNFLYVYESQDEYILSDNNSIVEKFYSEESSYVWSINRYISLDENKPKLIHPNQYLPATYFNKEEVGASYLGSVALNGDAASFINIPYNRKDCYSSQRLNMSYYADLIFPSGPTGQTFKYSLSDDGGDEYVVQSYYKFTGESCYEYAIFYINRYGGMDYELFNPASKVNYGYSRKELSLNTQYTLNVIQSNKRYLNNMTTQSFTLKTDYIADAKLAYLEELVSSPKTWIQDLRSGQIQPVLIKQNNFEFKKFKTDKMFNLTINCEASMNLNRK